MTLLELLQLLRKHMGLVIALPLVAAFIVALCSWLVLPNVYTTHVSLYVLAQTSETEQSSTAYSDFTVSQMLTNDVAKLVNSNRVHTDTADSLNLDSLSDYNISVDSQTNTRVITISVKGESAQMVAIVANALAKTTDDVAREIMDLESVNVIDQATTPVNPSGPPRLIYTFVGLLAGLIVAVLIVMLMDLLSTRIRNADEVEDLLQIPVIGHIPMIEK